MGISPLTLSVFLLVALRHHDRFHAKTFTARCESFPGSARVLFHFP